MKSYYMFSTIENPSLSEVGGKAMSLITSTKFDLPVPDGFVLTSSFFKVWFDYIRSTNEWANLNKSHGKDLKEICDSLKKNSLKLCLDSEQKKTVDIAIKQLNGTGTQLYAIRSSSPEEDLEGASFAGGYETILGVNKQNIEDAIKRCFASCLDERVYAYKKEHGFDVKQPKIAVIVQMQIASDTAGVGFSLNPLNNCYDEAVVTANHGLGESVVSGIVTPDTFIVNSVFDKIISKKLGKKETAIWLNKGGSTTEKTVKNKEVFCITDLQALKIVRLIRRVESYYHKPVDIEWAYRNNNLYLLQARPITTHIPLPDEMRTPPRERKRLYIDILIAKQGIQSMFSVMGLDFMEKSQRYLMRELMGGEVFGIQDGLYFNIGGRAYQDLGSSLQVLGEKTVINQWASSDILTRRIIEELDISEYIPKEIPKKLKNLKLKAVKCNIKTVMATLKAYKKPEKLKAQFIENQKEFLTQLESIKTQDLSPGILCEELLMWYMDVLKVTLPLTYAVMLGLSKVKKILKKENMLEKTAFLERSMPDNITLDMGLDMFRLALFDEIRNAKSAKDFLNKLKNGKVKPEFLKEWSKFVEKYGFRCPKELDISTLRPHENPVNIYKQLKILAKNTDELNNPLFIYNQSIQERKDVYNRICSHLHTKYGRGMVKKFNDNYNVVLAFYGFREIHKYFFIMITDILRQSVLKAAKEMVANKRLSRLEQVFDLHIEELENAIHDENADVKSIAARNTVFTDQLKRVANFPRVIDSRGKILYPPRLEAKPGEVQGEPISTGIARGKIKVLRTPDEKPLNKGEILVARATDPGWTPLFINAAGVILEVGGMLQHGALVAREYGKPCVAGIEDAVTVFKDGQEIELDGSTGVIRLL